MNIKKISAYLGFAIKSGKIIFGYDNLFVSKKNPILVLISSDLSAKMSQKVIDYCNNKQIAYRELDIPLGEIISRENCKVLAILDKGLTDAIMNEMEIEK